MVTELLASPDRHDKLGESRPDGLGKPFRRRDGGGIPGGTPPPSRSGYGLWVIFSVS